MVWRQSNGRGPAKCRLVPRWGSPPRTPGRRWVSFRTPAAGVPTGGRDLGAKLADTTGGLRVGKDSKRAVRRRLLCPPAELATGRRHFAQHQWTANSGQESISERCRREIGRTRPDLRRPGSACRPARRRADRIARSKLGPPTSPRMAGQSPRSTGFPRVLSVNTNTTTDLCGGPVVDREGLAIGVAIAWRNNGWLLVLPADIARSIATAD